MSIFYWLLSLADPRSIARSGHWSAHAASPVPVWLWVTVVVVAVLLAGLNLLPQNVMRLPLRLGLAGIRLAGFGLLLLMLCQVELRLSVDRTLKPKVALLTDTSESMDLKDAGGGRTRLEAARAMADALEGRLGDRSRLARYNFNYQLQAFDSKAPASATVGGVTRLIDSVAELAEREPDLESVILLTDGNDTAGNKGELLAPKLASRKIPVFPVVFGDTKAPRLASVKIANAGAYVRLGDQLKLTATLAASNVGEQVVSAKLYEQGNSTPLASRENIKLGKEPVDVTFAIKPEKAGDRVYKIVMDGVKDAASQKMLVAEHRVQVLNSRIKVLYLDIPRDERKILGHWLQRDPVLDVAVLTLLPKGGWYAQGSLQHKNAGDGLPNTESDLYKYDVIILGDIPRAYFREGGDLAETKMQRLVEFVTRRGGGLITLGGRAVYAAGNYQDSALAKILPFNVDPTNDPQMLKPFHMSVTPGGLASPIMSLEAEAQANRDAWMDMPTLDGNNRVGKVKAGASLLAVREGEGGSVPVIAVQNVGTGQVLAISADTTWRWEMMRPLDGEDYFRRFWGNAVRALAPDPRVQPNQPQVLKFQSTTAVGQTVTLATRLVDTTFRPLSGANISVKVTSPSGAVSVYYPRDGREAPGLYQYQLPLAEPGDYQIAVTNGEKTTTDTLTAGSGNEELDDPRANPQAMADLAKATNGKVFGAEDTAAVAEAINLTPRTYVQAASVPLWNLPVTLTLFIALVCLDTYLRKRRGMA